MFLLHYQSKQKGPEEAMGSVDDPSHGVYTADTNVWIKSYQLILANEGCLGLFSLLTSS